MSMLDDPDAPHRFGQTPYKGEMLSLVQPPPQPSATPPETQRKTKGTPRRPMAPLQADAGADRNAIVAFLAGEAAEVKDAQHDAPGAKLDRPALHVVPPLPRSDRRRRQQGTRARRMGQPRVDQGADREPELEHDVPQVRIRSGQQGPHAALRRQARADDLNLLAAWVRKKARGGK